MLEAGKAKEMTRGEWLKWLDQIETSLVRAEAARKDIDLVIVLRLSQEIAKERIKELEKDGGKTQV